MKRITGLTVKEIRRKRNEIAKIWREKNKEKVREYNRLFMRKIRAKMRSSQAVDKSIDLK